MIMFTPSCENCYSKPSCGDTTFNKIPCINYLPTNVEMCRSSGCLIREKEYISHQTCRIANGCRCLHVEFYLRDTRILDDPDDHI